MDKKKPVDPDKPNDDKQKQPVPVEVGGRGGPDPTRFRDYEIGGRCIDF